MATFLRHREVFHSVWLAQDLLHSPGKTLDNILETIGMVDVDQDVKTSAASSMLNNAANETSNPQPTSRGDHMSKENWEQARDIFFMLRIPFDVDIACNDDEVGDAVGRERLLKILTARHRKIGRYGPTGGYPKPLSQMTKN